MECLLISGLSVLTILGKAKGQGQDKDVLYARRQKNINKDPGGNKKKRADFKRREF